MLLKEYDRRFVNSAFIVFSRGPPPKVSTSSASALSLRSIAGGGILTRIKTMSSLLSHILIPLAILFMFSRSLNIDPKTIIVLSIFGTFPDSDIVLLHRATFHNIFVLMIPAIAFIFLRRKEILVIGFYIASHLILDIFNGGIYLLYPFYQDVFFSRVEVFINEHNISYIFDYGIHDKIANIRGKESLVSSENAAVIILIIVLLFVKWIISIVEKRYYVNNVKQVY